MKQFGGFLGLNEDGGAAPAPVPAPAAAGASFFGGGGSAAAASAAPAPSASGLSSYFAAPAAAAAPVPPAAASTAAAPSSFFSSFGAAPPLSSSAAAAASGSAKAPSLASVQAAVTGQDPEDAAWEARCALTRTQRMYGFGLCLALGCLVSTISTFKIGNPVSGRARARGPRERGAAARQSCGTLTAATSPPTLVSRRWHSRCSTR